MAVSDLYEVEIRSEFVGVVMSTKFYYGQVAVPTSGDSGALDLVNAARNAITGLAGWMIPFMVSDATLACYLVTKVLDSSATGPENAVAFDQTTVGLLSEPLPPSNTLQVHQIGETGVSPDYPQRVTYLGGIGEELVNNYAFTTTIKSYFTAAGLVRLLTPKAAGEAGEPWQLSVPRRNGAPDYVIIGYEEATLVPQPIFPSLRGSRQGFLCG